MTDAVANLIGAGAGGLVSGIASLFGADSQSKNVKRTNEMNYKIASEANKNQFDIARMNNQMQLDAMRENNAFNKQSAIDMFNLEAAYNTPEAQKQRLLQAGLNPATMYGSSSAANTVNASTPSASSSGISPSMPSMSVPTMQTPPSVLNTMFGNMESISRVISNIARSALDLTTKRSTASKLQAELDNIFANTKYTEAKTYNQEYNNMLDSIFAAGERTRRARKENEEIKNLSAQYLVACQQKDNIAADTALKQVTAAYQKTNNELLQQQTPILIENLKKQGKLLEAQTGAARAQEAAGYATAEYNKQLVNESESREKLNEQQYKFIDETWEWSKAGVQADTQSKQWQNIYDRSTIIARIEQALMLPGLTDDTRRELQERIKALENNNSVFNKRFALEVLGDVMNAFNSYTSGMKNATGATKDVVVPFLPD